MYSLYWVILVVLSSVLMISIHAQHYTVGVRVDRVPKVALQRNYICSKAGPQCGDCNTLIVCPDGQSNPLQTIQCRAPTPHCVINACHANASDSCTSAPDFMCTSSGVFPDPFDCTRYHVCHNVDIHDDIYQCPSGYIFNIKVKLCEKVASTPQNCGKIDCSKSANRVIVYPTNTAYYAFCMDYESYSYGAYGSVLPMMFKCEYEEFEIFNQTTGNCIFNCKAKGNFQDPANCQQYFACSAAGAIGDLIACPNRFVFDGTVCTMDRTKCQYSPNEKVTITTTTFTSTNPTTTTTARAV